MFLFSVCPYLIQAGVFSYIPSMELITLYAPWAALLLLDPVHDVWQINQGIEINHAKHTAWAGLGYILTSLPWFFIYEPSLLDCAGHLLILSAVRWNVHDLMLNVLRDLPLTYQGDGINDATTDKILKALPLNPLVTKGLVLAVCVAAGALLIGC